ALLQVDQAATGVADDEAIDGEVATAESHRVGGGSGCAEADFGNVLVVSNGEPLALDCRDGARGRDWPGKCAEMNIELWRGDMKRERRPGFTGPHRRGRGIWRIVLDHRRGRDWAEASRRRFCFRPLQGGD